MRDNGLVARRKKHFRATTDSKHDGPIAPNLLARDFTAKAASQGQTRSSAPSLTTMRLPAQASWAPPNALLSCADHANKRPLMFIKNTSAGLIIAVCFWCSACASGGSARMDSMHAQMDAAAPAMIGPRAAFDFGCAQDQIAIARVSNAQYGATGCGRRAVYAMTCPANASSGRVDTRNCGVIRNGEVIEDAPSQPDHVSAPAASTDAGVQ